MITYLRGEEKNLSRDLWEEAFREDSASFTDFYYSSVTARNRILADVEDGRVLSMIHLNPYALWVRDRVWETEYLVGVATRKRLWRQGRMRRLMQRLLRDLYLEKMPFCFLMPADAAIYRSFGFAYIADRERYEVAGAGEAERYPMCGDAESEAAFCEREREEALAEWMNGFLRQRYEVFVLRDAEYLRRLRQEIASENGTLDVLCRNEEIVGAESVWGLEERETRLCFGEEPYVRKLLNSEPLIMGRIIDLREFVRVIRLREEVQQEVLVIPLRVEDESLAQNSGDWLWRLDHKGSRLERPEGGSLSEQGEHVLRLGIDELAAWLFQKKTPRPALEYEGIVEPLKNVFLDEVV